MKNVGQYGAPVQFLPIAWNLGLLSTGNLIFIITKPETDPGFLDRLFKLADGFVQSDHFFLKYSP